ncbi:MAG: PEP-CTERM sorting domain-containing protein [Caldimonas sp.]
MRLSFGPAAALVSLAAMSAPAYAQLSFGEFVSGANINAIVGQHQTIGFAYAGNRFVGSVYNGTHNNQLYSTNLAGGSVQTFGAPIDSFTGEVYVTASLGLGGFGPGRDVYAGSESGGAIYRLSNDGSSQGQFAGAGIAGGVRSIAFDPYGLYGNQMVVATNAGNVYQVSSTGTAVLLANVGEDAEGLSFAPQSFGTFARGTLFVASEGSGSLRAISPGGTQTRIITGLSGAEMVSFVPLNLGSSGNPVEGFYAAAFPNNIVRVSADQFLPYLGDAIITSETGGGVYDVHFDGSTFVTSRIGTFPAQPEDGIFVTADIVQSPVPEPETYALMLAGLAGIGWNARRRKGQKAAR